MWKRLKLEMELCFSSLFSTSSTQIQTKINVSNIFIFISRFYLYEDNPDPFSCAPLPVFQPAFLDQTGTTTQGKTEFSKQARLKSEKEVTQRKQSILNLKNWE